MTPNVSRILYRVLFTTATVGLSAGIIFHMTNAASFSDTDINGSLALHENLYETDVDYWILKGELQIQNDDFEGALASYEKALQLRKDPEVAERTATLAITCNHLDKAIVAAQIWAEQDPSNITALGTVAHLFLLSDEVNQAVPYLKQLLTQKKIDTPEDIFKNLAESITDEPTLKNLLSALKTIASQEPKLLSAWLSVSEVAFTLQDLNSVHDALEKAEKISPDSDRVLLLKAEEMVQRNNAVGAIQYLQSKPKSLPHPDVSIYLADLLLKNNRASEATSLLQKLANDKTYGGMASFYLAQIHLESKNFPAAISCLNRAAKTPQYENMANYFLGRVYQETHDDMNAVKSYAKVNGGNYFVPAKLNSANILAAKGNVSQAVSILENVDVDDADQAKQIILGEAEIQYTHNDVRGAYQTLSSGITKFESDRDLLYSRALLGIELENYKDAEEDLQTALKDNPEDVDVLNALGFMLIRFKDRYHDSEKYLTTALKLAPENPAILDSLGCLKLKTNDLKSANELLKNAYQLSRDPEIAAHYGEALWLIGEREKASEIWLLALKDNPHDPNVQEALVRLNANDVMQAAIHDEMQQFPTASGKQSK